MSAPNFWELCAREKLQRGADWQMVQWELVGDTNDAIIRGAVPSGVYTRGPRKGNPKFERPLTDQCVVTKAECLARAQRYEVESGRCSKCGGNGQEWAGWNHEHGNRYRECLRCKGSGVAPVATLEA